MEEFEKIDWQPKIDDIVDDRFVNEERMKEESSMYKILHGSLVDPFFDLRTKNSWNPNGADKDRKKNIKKNPPVGKKNKKKKKKNNQAKNVPKN